MSYMFLLQYSSTWNEHPWPNLSRFFMLKFFNLGESLMTMRQLQFTAQQPICRDLQHKLDLLARSFDFFQYESLNVRCDFDVIFARELIKQLEIYKLSQATQFANDLRRQYLAKVSSQYLANIIFLYVLLMWCSCQHLTQWLKFNCLNVNHFQITCPSW